MPTMPTIQIELERLLHAALHMPENEPRASFFTSLFRIITDA